MPAPVFTIGHSTRSLEELIGMLRAVDVKRLVDIRTFPKSARNPQFNIDLLPDALAAAGIAYEHAPALGGRRKKSQTVPPDVNSGWTHSAFHNYADHAWTDAFQEALEQFLEVASREPSALMCSEAVWWRCHRRIVTDYILARKIPVIHLLTPQRSEPARLTPFAEIQAKDRIAYCAP
jgi:uncharacterized protein (DUF488 family)